MQLSASAKLPLSRRVTLPRQTNAYGAAWKNRSCRTLRAGVSHESTIGV